MVDVDGKVDPLEEFRQQLRETKVINGWLAGQVADLTNLESTSDQSRLRGIVGAWERGQDRYARMLDRAMTLGLLGRALGVGEADTLRFRDRFVAVVFDLISFLGLPSADQDEAKKFMARSLERWAADDDDDDRAREAAEAAVRALVVVRRERLAATAGRVDAAEVAGASWAEAVEQERFAAERGLPSASADRPRLPDPDGPPCSPAAGPEEVEKARRTLDRSGVPIRGEVLTGAETETPATPPPSRDDRRMRGYDHNGAVGGGFDDDRSPDWRSTKW